MNIKARGINNYFCSFHNSHYLDREDLLWADAVVYAEEVHYDIIHRRFEWSCRSHIREIVLSCGAFFPEMAEDYISKAEQIVVNRLSLK